MTAAAGVEELYPLVTHAIMRADTLDDLGAPGARDAYLDVSLLEERIASTVPVSHPEGQLARRGAVRAAVWSGRFGRAAALAELYASESGAPRSLVQSLRSLLPVHLDFPEGRSWRPDDEFAAAVFSEPQDKPVLFVKVADSADRASRHVVTELESSVSSLRSQFDVVFERSWSVPAQDVISSPVLEADGLIVIGGLGAAGTLLLHWAGARGIPTLILSGTSQEADSDVAASKWLHVAGIRSASEATAEWKSWLTLQSDLIRSGPLRRKVVESRFEPLRLHLQRHLDALVVGEEAAAAVVNFAKVAGLPPETLVLAVERPLALAALPADRLAALSEALHNESSVATVPWEMGVAGTLSSSEHDALMAAAREFRWSAIDAFVLRAFVRLGRRERIAAREQPMSTREDWADLWQRIHGESTIAPAWHSILDSVHHNNKECNTGNNIDDENRRPGTGGKPLCAECARLAR